MTQQEHGSGVFYGVWVAILMLYVLFFSGGMGFYPIFVEMQGRRVILIGGGKVAHEKNQFRAGMALSGLAVPVPDPRREIAAYYKTSAIKVGKTGETGPPTPPPFQGAPPDLPTYRSRGHRRLDAGTYDSQCSTCVWGCRMPVEMTIDHWNPSEKRYRFETFCYGPKSCPSYTAGPTRTVPGRKGMSYTEENRVDEDATSHRDLDD